MRFFPLLTLSLCTAAAFSGCDEPQQSTTPPPTITPMPAAMPSMSGGMMSTPFIVPPLVNPPLQSAAEARISSDEPVIGVLHKGIPRAFLLTALKDMRYHVINEHRGPASLAVTYCDRTDCVRVLEALDENPLLVQIAGFHNGEMQVRIKDGQFSQTAKDLPAADVPFTRTTWGTWLAENPETTLFTGEQADASSSNR